MSVLPDPLDAQQFRSIGDGQTSLAAEFADLRRSQEYAPEVVSSAYDRPG